MARHLRYLCLPTRRTIRRRCLILPLQPLRLDVGGWQDIVAVAAGSAHTLGLRADGTVVSAGNNASCQCDAGSWSGIQVRRAGA